MNRYTLIKGHPFAPSDNDYILIERSLPVGEPVPFGFNVLDGNMHSSTIMGVFTRFEIEEGKV